MISKRMTARIYGINEKSLYLWEKEDRLCDELAKRRIAIDGSNASYRESLNELFLELTKEEMLELWYNKFYPIFPLPLIYRKKKYPKGVYYNGRQWKEIPYYQLPKISD